MSDTYKSRIAHNRGRVGALSRSRTDDDAEFVAAKQLLAEAKIAQYISKTLAAAPPLTEEQRNALAELLKPVRRQAADQ